MSLETRQDAIAAVEMLPPGIETIRVTYPDLHGVQRGKDVPIREFEHVCDHGLAFCWAVMGTDLRHTPVVGGERGYPDMIAAPDLSTLVQVPWEPDVATCLADLRRAGGEDPEPTDPRWAVRRAQDAFGDLGYEAVIGPELEFFLCEPDPTKPGGWKRYVDNLSMVYTIGRQADPRGIVRQMLEGFNRMGLETFAANHEYMNSQYEINLRHSEAVDASDRAFRLKCVVKDVAAHNGMLATFIGKPFNDQGGSGYHLHLSLGAGGENAFASDETLMRRFIAGVLEHAPALMAFLNPTINAYRRLIPDSLAPTHANWGWDNRSCFVRIPPESGSSTRLEIRVGDGAANPYLANAAAMFAGLDGLRRELEPPAPIAGDAYSAEHPGAALPKSLDDALDALEADATLCGAMGAELVETFVTMKRFETDRYRQWVSDFDLAEYLHHL